MYKQNGFVNHFFALPGSELPKQRLKTGLQNRFLLIAKIYTTLCNTM